MKRYILAVSVALVLLASPLKAQWCAPYFINYQIAETSACPVLQEESTWYVTFAYNDTYVWTEKGDGQCGLKLGCDQYGTTAVKADPLFTCNVYYTNTEADIFSKWRDGFAQTQVSACPIGRLNRKQFYVTLSLGPEHFGWYKHKVCL